MSSASALLESQHLQLLMVLALVVRAVAAQQVKSAMSSDSVLSESLYPMVHALVVREAHAPLDKSATNSVSVLLESQHPLLPMAHASVVREALAHLDKSVTNSVSALLEALNLMLPARVAREVSAQLVSSAMSSASVSQTADKISLAPPVTLMALALRDLTVTNSTSASQGTK
jgi:hypothetical protein